MTWRSIGDVTRDVLRALELDGCSPHTCPGKGSAAQLGDFSEAALPAERKGRGAGRPRASQGGAGGKASNQEEPTSRPEARRVPLVHDASRSIATVMHRPLREPAPGSAVVIDLLAERERRHATCSAAAASLHRPQSAMLENPPHVPGSRQSG
jgi:hypothetical protein